MAGRLAGRPPLAPRRGQGACRRAAQPVSGQGRQGDGALWGLCSNFDLLQLRLLSWRPTAATTGSSALPQEYRRLEQHALRLLPEGPARITLESAAALPPELQRAMDALLPPALAPEPGPVPAVHQQQSAPPAAAAEHSAAAAAPPAAAAAPAPWPAGQQQPPADGDITVAPQSAAPAPVAAAPAAAPSGGLSGSLLARSPARRAVLAAGGTGATADRTAMPRQLHYEQLVAVERGTAIAPAAMLGSRSSGPGDSLPGGSAGLGFGSQPAAAAEMAAPAPGGSGSTGADITAQAAEDDSSAGSGRRPPGPSSPSKRKRGGADPQPSPTFGPNVHRFVPTQRGCRIGVDAFCLPPKTSSSHFYTVATVRLLPKRWCLPTTCHNPLPAFLLLAF